jgi:hypothetical protein
LRSVLREVLSGRKKSNFRSREQRREHKAENNDHGFPEKQGSINVRHRLKKRWKTVRWY